VIRDAGAQAVQFALAATFDAAARPLFETLLAAVGASGAPKTLGKRSPTVYAISSPAIGNFAAGLETLQSGPLLFTFADSEESLQFAYRAPTLMPGAAPPPSAPGPTPIASVRLDGGMVARLLQSEGAGESAKPALDFLTRMKRVDADVAADGDLFRVTVRAPIK
jgi:hypothetical protein